MMKKILVMVVMGGLLGGCTVREAVRLSKIAASGDADRVVDIMADKGISYADNPGRLEADMTRFIQKLKRFRDAVSGIWGEKDAKESSPKEYVKYTQGYKTRASVDFDAGIITVETVETENPEKSLQEAIVFMLLAPADPRTIDVYSSDNIAVGDEPFLYNEVLNFEGRPIRWKPQAEAFARRLVTEHKTVRQTWVGGKRMYIHEVRLNMVQDHLMVRARKFYEPVMRYAKEYGVSPNLAFAIMKTESDFNPFAVSHIPAYGLMQIVPSTAGRDVHHMLYGKKGMPTSEQLFDPETNIRYGIAYLHLLEQRYLAAISNVVSREYCVIAAYNGGPGAVLRSFDQDSVAAVKKINEFSPNQVYNELQAHLPAQETRQYLQKVGQARRQFVGL